MKQGKFLAVLGFLIVLALFLMMRPVREKACPLSFAARTVAIEAECRERGGVVENGMCTCPP